jgi:hypothetical protein
MPRKSHFKHETKLTEQTQQHLQEQPGEEISKSAKHFADAGPVSIEGVEANDLPDHGRGPVETDLGHEGKRRLPQQDGTIDDEGGMRASMDINDADKYGHGG